MKRTERRGSAGSVVQRYTYSVAWSPDDRVFVARVAEFPLLAAHGANPEAALREIRKVVGFVIEDLRAEGSAVPEPFGLRRFSGKFNVRISADLHRELAVEATTQGLSLNQLVLQKLAAH